MTIHLPHLYSNPTFSLITYSTLFLQDVWQICPNSPRSKGLLWHFLCSPFLSSRCLSQSPLLSRNLRPSLSLSQLFYLFQSQSLPLSPSFLLPCISGSVVQHTVFTVLRTASKSLGLRCGYYDNQVSIHSEAVCVCETERTGCECEWAEIVLTEITGLVQLTRHTHTHTHTFIHSLPLHRHHPTILHCQT